MPTFGQSTPPSSVKAADPAAPFALAADGFPIDPQLQRRARRASIGYSLLAIYYVAVAPNALRQVRWTGLTPLLQDLASRAEILLPLLAYLGANVLLAAAAWNVIKMTRWGSALVLLAATVFTVWMCGSLGISIGRGLQAGAAVHSLQWAIASLLMLAYVICLVLLWRPVRTFNARRDDALDAFEGRIGS
jgi:hypothetical protein